MDRFPLEEDIDDINEPRQLPARMELSGDVSLQDQVDLIWGCEPLAVPTHRTENDGLLNRRCLLEDHSRSGHVS